MKNKDLADRCIKAFEDNMDRKPTPEEEETIRKHADGVVDLRERRPQLPDLAAFRRPCGPAPADNYGFGRDGRHSGGISTS